LANSKLSALTQLTPLASTDIAYIVRPSVTTTQYKGTLSDIINIYPGLTSIGGLTTSANQMIYATASDTYATTALTAAGRALLDDADAAAQRVTLGLGTTATQESFIIAIGDETTAISATGTAIVTFRMPYAFTVTGVRASVNSATTTGTLTFDINEAGVSILSTTLTIDATEKTSTTAATAAVISDSSLADDAEITIDIDAVGDGTATGAKIVLIGYQT